MCSIWEKIKRPLVHFSIHFVRKSWTSHWIVSWVNRYIPNSLYSVLLGLFSFCWDNPCLFFCNERMLTSLSQRVRMSVTALNRTYGQRTVQWSTTKQLHTEPQNGNHKSLIISVLTESLSRRRMPFVEHRAQVVKPNPTRAALIIPAYQQYSVCERGGSFCYRHGSRLAEKNPKASRLCKWLSDYVIKLQHE